MRKGILYILLVLCTSAAWAQKTKAPKWTKQAGEAVFTLAALQENGDTLTSRASLIAADGQMLAPCKPLQHAVRAWVTDPKGTAWPVARLVGANTTYNVALLRAEIPAKQQKKLQPLAMAAVQPAAGEAVWLLPAVKADTIRQQEKAGTHAYYTLGTPADAALEGSPVLNAEGQLTAMLQVPLATPKAPCYALAATIASELRFSALDANKQDFAHCHIAKQLPEREEDATTFLYLCNRQDSLLYATYLSDFRLAHPANATGYTLQAEHLAQRGNAQKAERVYQQALSLPLSHPDEVLYSRARVIYNMVLQSAADLPETWTLQQAQADLQAAYKQQPLPVYLQKEAETSYALKDYAHACDLYLQLTQTSLRSAELFAYANLCKEAMQAPLEEQLALADSAVACFTKPYTREAATSLYLRAKLLQRAERGREALQDLNDYERLVQGLLGEQFYYERMHLNLSVRLLMPALSDVEKAISLNPQEPVYHAEKAALLYRMGEFAHAIESCLQALSLAPDMPDAHRIWGLSLRRQGNLPAAREHLQQAAQLGDALAPQLLEELGE